MSLLMGYKSSGCRKVLPASLADMLVQDPVHVLSVVAHVKFEYRVKVTFFAPPLRFIEMFVEIVGLQQFLVDWEVVTEFALFALCLHRMFHLHV